MRSLLEEIIAKQNVTVLLQPILEVGNGRIIGYEALSRGPSLSALHSPLAMFRVAREHGLLAALDRACVQQAMKTFSRLNLAGRIFINVSPESLLDTCFDTAAIVQMLKQANLPSDRVVIEITENASGLDYGLLREAVGRLREERIEVAIDDLGEGFSSLRLWSELKPAFVKIDKHFITGLHADPHRIEFVRSIRQLAEGSHSRLIAEGVETRSELAVLKELGIRYVQGYFVGHPSPTPLRLISGEVEACLSSGPVAVLPVSGSRGSRQVTAGKLVIRAPAVAPGTTAAEVVTLMNAQPELHAVAVVSEDGVPLGIIHRPALLARFSSLYGRELNGRKPCLEVMDGDPLVVDRATAICDLSELVVSKGKTAFTEGFVITAEGRYLGVGSGFDLMREITELQIVAARYANPLSGLPGNVPVQEHMERLLEKGQPFVTAYFDIDQFKPYNDVYGFRRGDDIIQLLARILKDNCNPELDFVGHIGGDDFVVLFQSPDWELRCRGIRVRFNLECTDFFTPEHAAARGYSSEDRRGMLTFHSLASLSVGAVVVDPRHFRHHQEVVRAASDAKRMAKRVEGGSFFIDKRRVPFSPGAAAARPRLDASCSA